ncbi:GGDEF domain-containing protein [Amycolatopsis aidingensis]|uniref:GGDEF domain-containing protein n=1 Tax=Amycolatopsis aidingensis TaxID=2842453 RepID=UPI001C0AD0B0|nr:GGDEF domain-containing protein [Amycolatopsis aidingensis]
MQATSTALAAEATTRTRPRCSAGGQPLGYTTTDHLTGLLDRWSWDKRAVRELRRDRRPSILLLLDLDRFKTVNDTFGHLAGDEILQAVAGIIKDAVRASDIVGRYGGHGGDEFLVLLPATVPAHGLRVARRIRSRIRQAHIDVLSADGRSETITRLSVSIGLTVRSPADEGDLRQLVRRADAALLLAKHDGRDRIQIDNQLIGLDMGPPLHRRAPGSGTSRR